MENLGIGARDAKACPFCGCTDILPMSRNNYESTRGDGTMYLECYNCGVAVWNHPHKEMTYEDAFRAGLAKWNHRTKVIV